MKQYLIDQLNPKDVASLQTHLDSSTVTRSVPGIYRLVVPDELLTSIQQDHADCGPFYMAMELTEDRMACEFLVRASGKVRCECMGYADAPLRQWAMASVDAMLEHLQIHI